MVAGRAIGEGINRGDASITSASSGLEPMEVNGGGSEVRRGFSAWKAADYIDLRRAMTSYLVSCKRRSNEFFHQYGRR